MLVKIGFSMILAILHCVIDQQLMRQPPGTENSVISRFCFVFISLIRNISFVLALVSALFTGCH